MPVNFRAILTTFAAMHSGVLAAVALTNPALSDWAIVASQSEIGRWISTGPTAVALSAVVAVLACALAQRHGSIRAAWIAVAAATIVIAAISAVVGKVAVLDLLIALIIVKSIAAGIILGCAVAAVWDRTTARNILMMGVLTTFLSIRVFANGVGSRSTSAVGEPSWVLLGGMTIAAIACAATAQAEFRIRRPDVGEIRIALVVIAALAIGHRVLGSVIDRQEYASEGTAWFVMAACAAAALALTAIAASRLGDQSGAGGKFLWAATALAAASAPFFVDMAQQQDLWRSPWRLILVAGVGVALGLRLGRYLRNTTPRLVGLAVLVAVPLSELLPTQSAHGTIALAVKLAALGFGGALLLSTLAPGSLVDATLGLTIPFAAMTFFSIATLTDQLTWVSTRANFSFAGNLTEFTSIPVEYFTAQTIGRAILFTVIIAACGFAILRPRRTDTEAVVSSPDEAEVSSPD